MNPGWLRRGRCLTQHQEAVSYGKLLRARKLGLKLDLWLEILSKEKRRKKHLSGRDGVSKPGSWWCTGKPSVLQSMGLQRVGHDWATELNWIILHNHTIVLKVFRATGWTEKARQGCFLMWNCYHSEVYCVVFLLWLNFIFYFRLDLLMSTLRLFL